MSLVETVLLSLSLSLFFFLKLEASVGQENQEAHLNTGETPRTFFFNIELLHVSDANYLNLRRNCAFTDEMICYLNYASKLYGRV